MKVQAVHAVFTSSGMNTLHAVTIIPVKKEESRGSISLKMYIIYMLVPDKIIRESGEGMK